MRDWTRLLIFAVIVAVITLTLAPPVRTSADSGSASLFVDGETNRQFV